MPGEAPAASQLVNELSGDETNSVLKSVSLLNDFSKLMRNDETNDQAVAQAKYDSDKDVLYPS